MITVYLHPPHANEALLRTSLRSLSYLQNAEPYILTSGLSQPPGWYTGKTLHLDDPPLPRSPVHRGNECLRYAANQLGGKMLVMQHNHIFLGAQDLALFDGQLHAGEAPVDHLAYDPESIEGSVNRTLYMLRKNGAQCFSFDTRLPFIAHATEIQAALSAYGHTCHLPTAVYNLFPRASTHVHSCQQVFVEAGTVFDPDSNPEYTFLSCAEDTRHLHGWLDALFPHPSPFERVHDQFERATDA